jgi:hypothetical protein
VQTGESGGERERERQVREGNLLEAHWIPEKRKDPHIYIYIYIYIYIRYEKDTFWEPIGSLKRKDPYVMKLVLNYDEKIQAFASGMEVTHARTRTHARTLSLTHARTHARLQVCERACACARERAHECTRWAGG